MIIFKQSGDFKNTENFFNRFSKANYVRSFNLDEYGREGVDALMLATPVDTGLTASSWGYEISNNGYSYAITWTNSNIVDGIPIVVLLQYGHGTRNGGYVQGRDFINPAMQPIFDRIANEAWKEVIR